MQGQSPEVDIGPHDRDRMVKTLASLSVHERSQHAISDDGPLGAMEILDRPFTSALASPRGIECEIVFACLLDVRNQFIRTNLDILMRTSLWQMSVNVMLAISIVVL